MNPYQRLEKEMKPSATLDCLLKSVGTFYEDNVPHWNFFTSRTVPQFWDTLFQLETSLESRRVGRKNLLDDQSGREYHGAAEASACGTFIQNSQPLCRRWWSWGWPAGTPAACRIPYTGHWEGHTSETYNLRCSVPPWRECLQMLLFLKRLG